MKFSREFLDKIKETVNLVDLASEYTDLDKAGPYLYVGHCPHPKHNDSDASFCVSTKTNTWCCYGCHSDKKNKDQGNYGSDCIAFIEWVHDGKISWVDAVKYLADKINLPLPSDKNDKQYETNYRLMKKFERDLNDESLDYLYSREITDNEIIQWHIGYDKQEDRIVFPLLDTYNNIVGFNKRLLSKETKGVSKKYLHSPDSDVFKKANYLYGFNQIDNSFKYIILSEGVFDVILARKYGLKNVVCALGTSLSEYQIELLEKQKKEIIIAYDSDKKGMDTMKKVIPILESKGIPTRLIILPEDKDLADMAMLLKHGIKDYVLKKSMTYSYYLIQDLINDFNRDLFTLYSEFNILLNTIIQKAPEHNRGLIKAYVENNVYGKELDINNVMQRMSQQENM